MSEKIEGMAEELKKSETTTEAAVPGVRGPQTGVHDDGVKGKSDSPTNWSRSGNPTHDERAGSPVIESGLSKEKDRNN